MYDNFMNTDPIQYDRNPPVNYTVISTPLGNALKGFFMNFISSFFNANWWIIKVVFWFAGEWR